MTLDVRKRFALAEGVHARRFGADLVILDLTGGMYFGLDEVGAEVWERLRSGRSPEEIAAELESLYDVEPPQLKADIVALTRRLLEKGLLVEVAP